MTFQFDHAVILVDSLETAVADYTTLGFHVVPGGEHTEGGTHNALIAFEDGSYLELLAFKGGLQTMGTLDVPLHSFLGRAKARSEGKEGLVDFALVTPIIEVVVAAAEKRGLTFEPLAKGGRKRPDGQDMAWRLAIPHSLTLPFLIADITPRALRVPGEADCRHPNGVRGVVLVEVSVRTVAAGTAHYGALLDMPPMKSPAVPDAADFMLGRTIIRLQAGLPGQDRPLSLTLAAGDGQPARSLDAALTHGTHISVVAE